MKALASIRLTIWLLVALAALAGAGTFGFENFHTGIPYRLVFCILLLNLAACGLGRSVEGFRNFLCTGSEPPGVPVRDRQLLAGRLKANGFRVVSDEPLRAVKRTWAFLGFPLVHLSPFLIAAGAFWGSEAGFVGTANMYIGSVETKVYDNGLKKDVELPFAVNPKEMTRQWYPLALKLKLETADGAARGEVTAVEGERFKVPGTALEALVVKFDPDRADIEYTLFFPGGQNASFSRRTLSQAPVRLIPDAYKGEVKKIEVRTAFFDANGRQAGEALISVNSPATVKGYKVFLSNTGLDEQGKPYAGFQVVSDPGQELLWVGSVFFTLGLFLLLFVDGGWVSEEEGLIRGRASKGRRALAKLLGGAEEGG